MTGVQRRTVRLDVAATSDAALTARSLSTSYFDLKKSM
jgi:hypothetical protein